MAISPIGNLVYINQNTQATLQAMQNRTDHLTPVQEYENKTKQIQETRTPESIQKANKDPQEESSQKNLQKNPDKGAQLQEESEKSNSHDQELDTNRLNILI